MQIKPTIIYNTYTLEFLKKKKRITAPMLTRIKRNNHNNHLHISGGNVRWYNLYGKELRQFL